MVLKLNGKQMSNLGEVSQEQFSTVVNDLFMNMSNDVITEFVALSLWNITRFTKDVAILYDIVILLCTSTNAQFTNLVDGVNFLVDMVCIAPDSKVITALLRKITSLLKEIPISNICNNNILKVMMLLYRDDRKTRESAVDTIRALKKHQISSPIQTVLDVLIVNAKDIIISSSAISRLRQKGLAAVGKNKFLSSIQFLLSIFENLADWQQRAAF